ncbi:P-loop containing nucleoside triphosphate hydrolase protein [Bisporella sp. PMI_857]|nr:P-loop containing nucleoside triphosphate hydrolase protein [Bisporella sp. PMI_857]
MGSREKTIKVIGPNGAGKATTIGCMLFKYGGIDLLTMERFQHKGITTYDGATRNMKSLNIQPSFHLPSYHVTISDTSVGEADCAILVLSANTKAEEQVVKQAIGAAKRLIILVNKMDVINWSEEQFQGIEEEVKNIPIIPISALHGDNVVEKSSRSPWFKGWNNGNQSGVTLLEALEVSLQI